MKSPQKRSTLSFLNYQLSTIFYYVSTGVSNCHIIQFNPEIGILNRKVTNVRWSKFSTSRLFSELNYFSFLSSFYFDIETETETWKSHFSILILISETLTILRLMLRLLLHSRGRRYYRNQSGIAIPKGLVSVSESNFAHPWVSVSVSVSYFSIFGYPTQ